MTQLINDKNFKSEVLESTIPVLVDYFAQWCGPCKSMVPSIDAIAAEYEGRIKVVKIDIDESSEVANDQGIRGVPTFMIFQNGVSKATKVGAMSKGQLAAFIETNT